MRKICTIDNCNEFRVGRGLCRTHYMRVKRTGSVDERHKPRLLCTYGDENPSVAFGLCENHYRQQKRDMKERRPCAVCEEPIGKNRKNYCSEKCQKEGKRRIHLRNRYGLESEDILTLLESQQNKCPICLEDLIKFNIDHDHKTGAVRGILCHKCNPGLGLFDDHIETLKRAIRYLEGTNRRSVG